MSLHAVLVTEHTIDFIEQMNGGSRPPIEMIDRNIIFIHPDRVDDPPLDSHPFMTSKMYYQTYKYHECPDDNCNIVEKI